MPTSPKSFDGKSDETEDQIGEIFEGLSRDLEAFITRADTHALASDPFDELDLTREVVTAFCPASSGDIEACWLLHRRPVGSETPSARTPECRRCQHLRDMSAEPARELFSNVLSVIDRLLKANLELGQRANRDPLTGVYNRAFLDEALELEMAKAERTGGQILFIIIDVDDFKTLNDAEGHLEGDKYLINLASLLRSHVRASDMIVRFGGDEFLIVAPRAEDEACGAILSRLQAAARLTLAELPSFSMGCATWCVGDDVRGTIRLADERMYHHKRTNQVELEASSCA